MIPAGYHRCPAPDCPTVISDGYVACRAHYLTLPLAERVVLGMAFRVREQAPDVYALAVERTRRLVGAE